MTEKFVVLVVDDNTNNRITLRALLSRLVDCAVLEAASGEAALLATLEHAVHLVLLDVQMPGMDGFETAQHLQMTARTRNIPVVFVTAVFKAEEFAARGFALGAVDYLTKPIDDNLLLSRLRLYQHLHLREQNLASALKMVSEREHALRMAKEEIEVTSVQLRKLSLAVKNSPHSLFITNSQGMIEYVNPMFVQTTGYSASEAIGQTPKLIQSGKTSLTTYQELWNTISAGDIWRGELVNRRKDGSLYWVSLSIAPVHDANGLVSHFICMHVDITEKVQAQQELLRAKDAAEAANRAKSVFLANMSHELRTPLNAVLGFSRMLLRDSQIGVESRKKLETINRSGQHLLSLINDVLDISRIEANRIDIQHVSFDLVGLLNSIEEMIRGRADEKRLNFVVEHAADLPAQVEGDAPHLKQVLINLLGNAVKYTQHGQVRLRVSCARPDIVFEVSDTGCGITAEEQQHLFQAFYQTEGAIVQGEGTGLGLAISLQYTRLMGGHLSVQSQPKQGSTFTLKVPLPTTQAAAIAQVPMPTVQGLDAGQSGLRILVVDDKQDNRELLRMLLESIGFEVSTASDGQQAVDVFQSWKPCFIWMDVRMPVMDGYAATRIIRGLPGGNLVKIVALTASVFEDDRAAVMAAGCDAMAFKPIEEERVFAVMGDLLGLRYRYADAEVSQPLLGSNKIDLRGLHPDLLHQLRVASEALDMDAIPPLLEAVRVKDPVTAAALDSLVQGFRFDRIREMCDSACATTGDRSEKDDANLKGAQS